jgi:hypothetical protein
MPPALTQSAISKLYKTMYPPGTDLTNYSKRPTPFGSRLKVKDELYGANLTWGINLGRGQGISGGQLDATTPAAKASAFLNWTVPSDTATSYLYARVTHDIPSIKRSEKDLAAFMKLSTKSIQEHIDNMKMHRFGHQVWSDGAGDLGRVLSVTGSDPVTTITLTNVSDHVKFDGGGFMTLQFNPNRTGNAGTIRTSTYTITKVNRLTSAGTCILTVTRTTGTGAGNDPAANDYIYLSGTYDKGVNGVPAWLPSTDPSSTLFYGVDRTQEMQLLSGWRGGWEGSISRSASKICHYMGSHMDTGTSALWLHPYRWYQLSEELKGEKSFMLDDARTLEWGTSVLRMVTPSGIIPVASDEYVPADAGYLLNHDTWEYLTTGPMIHAADEDVTALRLSDSDALEYRFRSLAFFRCTNPGKNAVFPISQSL